MRDPLDVHFFQRALDRHQPLALGPRASEIAYQFGDPLMPISEINTPTVSDKGR